MQLGDGCHIHIVLETVVCNVAHITPLTVLAFLRRDTGAIEMYQTTHSAHNLKEEVTADRERTELWSMSHFVSTPSDNALH